MRKMFAGIVILITMMPVMLLVACDKKREGVEIEPLHPWLNVAVHWCAGRSGIGSRAGQADAYRDCIIERDAFDDQDAQRTCLGEVDDTAPSFLTE